MRAVLQGWPSGAGRQAKGWLGSTAGITDDGELANKLMHPSHEVPRVYLAKVKGVPDEASLRDLLEFARAKASLIVRGNHDRIGARLPIARLWSVMLANTASTCASA